MKLINCLILCGILSTNMVVNASDIKFSGFATIAGGLTFDDDETLYGYDDSFSLGPDSLFGLQVSSEINDKWGATAQILSRGNEDWDTKFAWAYVSYQATDDVRFLFGRQRIPFYMYSDFLDVSYTYHWITGVNSVYALPIDEFDGLGMTYNSEIGEFDSTLNLFYGRNTGDMNIGGIIAKNSDVKDLFGAALTLNRDWLTLRAGYTRAENTIPISDFEPLINGWRLADFNSVADDIELKDDEMVFLDFAVIVDYEKYLFVLEIINLDDDDKTFFAQQDAYYVSFGYKIRNDMLLHFTHSKTKEENSLDLLSSVPAGLDPGLDALIGGTVGLLTAINKENEADTLGLRWDYDDSIALKAEITLFSDKLNPALDATLVRFAISTVF